MNDQWVEYICTLQYMKKYETCIFIKVINRRIKTYYEDTEYNDTRENNIILIRIEYKREERNE